MSENSRDNIVRLLVTAAVLAAVGLSVLAYQRWSDRDFGSASTSIKSQVESYTANKQRLNVVFVETGRLRAIKRELIFPQITGRQLRVTWLVPEGSTVKEGDRLVSFESKEFEESLRTLTGELEAARQQLIVAKAALDIALSTGKSSVAAAKTKLKQSEVEWKTYRDLEGPKRIGELDKSINESRAKLAESMKAVDEARRAIDDQLFIEDEQKKVLDARLADARDSADTARRILDNFLLQKKIFRQYEYPQQYDAKLEAFKNAELEVSKAETTAARETTQKQAEVAKIEEQIARLERQIDQARENISKCTITAPVSGLVVYGDPSANVYYGERLAVGANWYGGNALMNIPDLSAFEVDVGIPEEYRGRVQEGVPVSITLDAVPDLTISGRLKSIAKVAQQPMFYMDESGSREFRGVVSLDATDPRLVSGMSARVEIIADTVEDALCIPVDAVFNIDGEPKAFVHEQGRWLPRKVRPGKRNDNLVQIVDGLSPGEVVALVPPAQFEQANAATRPASAR